jgi:hypothetical protein
VGSESPEWPALSAAGLPSVLSCFDPSEGVTYAPGAASTRHFDADRLLAMTARLRAERERQERDRFYVAQDVWDRLLAEGHPECELRAVCKVVPGLEAGSAYQFTREAWEQLNDPLWFLREPPPPVANEKAPAGPGEGSAGASG